ncbi:hypothetical protein D0T51_01595 [Parabacteroides sp. 52]|nr:hypothetical protein [Parabacteroides sp. 52]
MSPKGSKYLRIYNWTILFSFSLACGISQNALANNPASAGNLPMILAHFPHLSEISKELLQNIPHLREIP